MKEKQVYKKIWPLPVKDLKNIFFMVSSCTYYVMYLNVDRQGCVIKTVAYSLRTDRETHGRHMADGQTKVLKIEGPMIMSIDIFYFKTVIIGGPKSYVNKYAIPVLKCI